MAHILLVEDDALLATTLLSELSRDHRVTKVPDGSFVMSAIEKDRPDLLLLDLIMPHMDGFEVLQALRNETTTTNIPVLVLTNLSGAPDIDRARHLGAADVFVKAQYTLQDIHAKINEFCAAHALPAGR